MRLCKAILRLLICTPVLTGVAQDFHFTNPESFSLLVNPAQAGNFQGNLRIENTYRSQWKSVAGHPYKTYAVSIDGKAIKFGRRDQDFFAGNLYYLNDISGNPRLIQNLFRMDVAYSKSLGERNISSFEIGFSGGYCSRRIIFSEYTWDAQYQNGYDPSLPTGELFSGAESKSFNDFGTGVSYFFSNRKTVEFAFGLSTMHLTEPQTGFLGKDPLYRKYSFHGNASLRLGRDSRYYLEPGLFLMLQGPNTLMLGGTSIKYLAQTSSRYTGYYENIYVKLGGFVRASDALILSSQIDYGPASLGLAYDINISPLSIATNGRGSIELFLKYVLEWKTGK